MKETKFLDIINKTLCDNSLLGEDCAFLKAYKAQLDKLNVIRIQNSLGKLGTEVAQNEKLKDVDFAFLVYETPANPCSERTVIQQWFREHGMPIEEWQP